MASMDHGDLELPKGWHPVPAARPGDATVGIAHDRTQMSGDSTRGTPEDEPRDRLGYPSMFTADDPPQGKQVKKKRARGSPVRFIVAKPI